MRQLRCSLLAVMLCVTSLGCIVEAPGADKPGKRQTVVQQAPPMQVRNGANLEGKVEIVGAVIQPGQLTLGEQARVRVAFRVLEAIPQDYLIFVHVEDADGRMERLNVDHHPVGGTRPTSKWNVGETIFDDFAVYLPAGAPARAVNIFIGLWQQQTDTRMRLKNPEAVRHDGRDRILLATVPVAQL